MMLRCNRATLVVLSSLLSMRHASLWWLLVAFVLVTTTVIKAGDYNYTTNSDDTLTITGYTGPGGDIIIPSTIDGKTVAIIGDYAFSVIAFFGNATLTSVTIPDSVTSIGKWAFQNNRRLTTVLIGKGVANIGTLVFFACTSLVSIAVDPGNSVYSSLDGVLFNKNQTTLIQYPAGKAGSYTIPDSVTSIGDEAFLYSIGLTSVIIPDSVISIGTGAFAYCDNLTSVTISDSVTSIGDKTFLDCDSLISVTIPDSVINIGDSAFFSTGLTNVTIGTGVVSIGNRAFGYCDNLTSVTIPDSVINIGDSAFSETGLTSVTIPDSVISIGDAAFSSTGLTNVTIGTGVASIGARAFWGTSINSVTIPPSVTMIGVEAFVSRNLIMITVDPANSVYSSVNGVLVNKSQTTLIQYPAGKAGSYTIPDSITSIWNGAFSRCIGLTSVTIPDSVISIGDLAFYSTGLTSVTIPDSVTSIGDDAFLNSDSLTSVMIGNGVTSIGTRAFAYCDNLTSVTIGTGLTSIGNKAFKNYRKLLGVYFMGNAPSIGSDVFEDDNYTTVYYLPGPTGWGWTFGERPAMPWWDGPQISANGTREDVSLNRGEPVKITVATTASSLAVAPLDWWIIARANSSMEYVYLNNSRQWVQFDASFSNCRPAYQGGLFNLPSTAVLNTTELPIGSYTFWFAIDYPMDGILNLGGYILIDSVNVTVN